MNILTSNNTIMMDNKILQNYIEDVTEIFHYTKKQFNYDEFANTCKKIFDKSINRCEEESIKSIKKNYETYKDDPLAVIELLNYIQEKTKELFVQYKIQDEIWKGRIYDMSPGFETDSHEVFDFDKNFKTIIKL